MDAEITPEAGELERAAILAALERAAQDGAAPGSRSAWREAGLEEATGAGDDDGGAQTLRPRSARGATRA